MVDVSHRVTFLGFLDRIFVTWDSERMKTGVDNSPSSFRSLCPTVTKCLLKSIVLVKRFFGDGGVRAASLRLFKGNPSCHNKRFHSWFEHLRGKYASDPTVLADLIRSFWRTTSVAALGLAVVPTLTA